MTPERYQKAGHLYHAALEIEPEARAAFLDEACGEDEELRREAESLLRAHDKVGNYFAAPAVEVAAALVAGRQNLSLAGQSFSHYRVLSLIGAGGMGEVYLAEDTRLGRKVALKLLPKEFTEDPDRVRRFELEARAASSLNHPNIVTIFEVGQVDGRHFIATEYIDGQTLRERISGGQLEEREALEVTAQIASALEAAHEAGIVHRDIKPENVMVRRNGLVKVLDFGLAKLAEGQSLGAGSEAPTVISGETTPGLVLGTVSYMSPEQARGLKVDARSDNFSLGVVLYEMVAGRCPFEGATPSDVMAAILQNEPLPLARVAQNVPGELVSIVEKALCKDREERYQTAGELSADLKSLKQELEVEARLNRSLQPGTDKALGEKISNHQYIATEPGRGYRFVASVRERSMQPNQAGARHDSHARKPKAILVLTILAVLAAGISIGAYIFITRRSAASFQTMKMTPLTTSGVVSDAVISPDGKYVVYVAGKPGRQSVSIRQVSTANDREIIEPEDVTYFGLTFSRDGNHIYYVRSEKDSSLGYLYRMPTFGGVSKKLATDVDSRIALSPDGSRLAFVRYDPREKTIALIVANIDGSAERLLASRTGSEGFAQYDAGPAWSPDGKTIACAAANHDDAGSYMNVIEVSIEQGTQQPFGSDRWYNIGQVVWLEDGSGIVMTAARQISSPVQVWSISRASAEARRITNDLNDYRDVSLTADNSALLIVNTVRVSSLWIVPGGRAALAKQITPGKFDGETGLTWTPDHKIIYTSRKSGNLDLWVMDEDGGNQKQLTADAGTNSTPSISTDGHYILFCSDRSGAPNVWRMERDGSNPMRLTRGSFDDSPFCSPDGRWVFYQGTSFDMPMLSKVPIDGGESVVVSERFVGRHPTISPDGRLIAVQTFDIEREPHNRAVAIISSESGRTITVLDSPSRMVVAGFLWASDARSLTYIDERDGVSNIWSLPLAGGNAKPLTDFNSDRMFRFEWSRDGKQLLCARGVETSDVVLIRNFK